MNNKNFFTALKKTNDFTKAKIEYKFSICTESRIVDVKLPKGEDIIDALIENANLVSIDHEGYDRYFYITWSDFNSSNFECEKFKSEVEYIKEIEGDVFVNKIYDSNNVISATVIELIIAPENKNINTHNKIIIYPAKIEFRFDKNIVIVKFIFDLHLLENQFLSVFCTNTPAILTEEEARALGIVAYTY